MKGRFRPIGIQLKQCAFSSQRHSVDFGGWIKDEITFRSSAPASLEFVEPLDVIVWRKPKNRPTVIVVANAGAVEIAGFVHGQAAWMAQWSLFERVQDFTGTLANPENRPAVTVLTAAVICCAIECAMGSRGELAYRREGCDRRVRSIRCEFENRLVSRAV